MGQYHYVVNLDKKQWLHPHELGDGLKLLEFGSSSCGTMSALALLLGTSARDGGRGGGDPRHDAERVIGSWAGDRIAIVGDYAESNDLPPEFEADKLYFRASEGEDGWVNISPIMRRLLEENLGVKFSGTGWLDKKVEW